MVCGLDFRSIVAVVFVGKFIVFLGADFFLPGDVINQRAMHSKKLG